MNEYLNSSFEGSNLGGLQSIRIIRLNEIISIPDLSSGSISYNAIQLAANAEFQQIYFTPETGYFTDQEIRGGSGNKFSKEVGFEIPKMRTEIVAGLKSYENCRNALWLTDMNGTHFLVFPLRLARKKQIPGQISQKNGISIVLTGESKDESPILTDVPLV